MKNALLCISILAIGCAPGTAPELQDWGPGPGGESSTGGGGKGSGGEAGTTGGGSGGGASTGLAYPINDTGQKSCYSNSSKISCPSAGGAFHGQDAQYKGRQMSFKDNGDGTVSDLKTGLMWAKKAVTPVTWKQAVSGAKSYSLAGYKDWRLPSIKEMYSLIHFEGSFTGSSSTSKPYIDTKTFDYSWGDVSAGEREMDVQYTTTAEYVDTTMHGDHTVFGVNFADGRIKGYGTVSPHGTKTFEALYVRGSTAYGKNKFVLGGDGTIIDKATGLTWQQGDNGKATSWKSALAYCEGLSLAGKKDWRLPNAKELQSIVDYSRSPATTGTAAISSLFKVTTVESWYWSSTTHLEGPAATGRNAVYVAFGRATGYMASPPGTGNYQLLDVHGAGAQRSDPKSGNPADYPHGHGPQGDEIRIYNYARCVRGGAARCSGD